MQRIKFGQFFGRLHRDTVFELGHKRVVAGDGFVVQYGQITGGRFAKETFVFQAAHTNPLAVVNMLKQPKFQPNRDKSLNQCFVVMVAAGGIHDVGQQRGFNFGPFGGRHFQETGQGHGLDGGGVAKGCSWCTRDAWASHRQDGAGTPRFIINPSHQVGWGSSGVFQHLRHGEGGVQGAAWSVDVQHDGVAAIGQRLVQPAPERLS